MLWSVLASSARRAFHCCLSSSGVSARPGWDLIRVEQAGERVGAALEDQVVRQIGDRLPFGMLFRAFVGPGRVMVLVRRYVGRPLPPGALRIQEQQDPPGTGSEAANSGRLLVRRSCHLLPFYKTQTAMLGPEPPCALSQGRIDYPRRGGASQIIHRVFETHEIAYGFGEATLGRALVE